MQGETLRTIASHMTDWNTWRSMHPKTTASVMHRTADQYRRSWYRDLGRHVIGIVHHQQVHAWRFEDLAAQPVVNDAVADASVLVVFEPMSSTARIYDRTLDGVELTFQLSDGKLSDHETNSTWDLLTGREITSTSVTTDRKRRLNRLPGVVSFEPAWYRFYPTSTYWCGPVHHSKKNPK